MILFAWVRGSVATGYVRRCLPCLALLGAISSPLSLAQAPSSQGPAPSEATLRRGFQSPPPEARLRCYWWWLNGNTTEETITRDLTEMSRKGFGGVLLVDANGSDQNGNDNVPPGPLFGSPAWVQLYLHALRTAAALHLEVNLNITSGWNLGGPDVTPDQASKLLTWTRTVVGEDHAFDGVLPMPPVVNSFYRQIAVLAYPLAHGAPLPGEPASGRPAIHALSVKTAAVETGISMPPSEPLLEDAPPSPGEQDTQLDQVVDLSRQVDPAGHIAWRPPSSGSWEILRIGYTDSDARVSTSSGAWQGLAIDYLDRSAFDTYWNHTVAPLLEAARPYLKTTLVNLATDSWEVGGANWTGRFADEFRARRGYDPIRYLPAVAGRIVTDRATSDRFLDDLRRTVGDLLTDHYDHFAERAREYGLGIQCESGGPHGAPIDALETFRNSAVPQTEYWAQSAEHRSSDKDRYFTKEVASAADIYGKRFAAEEGMTSIGPQWSESLASDLKPSFDQALTEGMNRLVWHEFTSEPKENGLPGNEYFAGTHLNPNVTWWAQSEPFFLYLNRSQFLLQQGHAVDDVLYFYGDEVPNFVRLKRDDPARVLPGYDYDVTGAHALLHSLSLRAGTLSTPAGNIYRLLVLPRSRRMSLASLERIATFVHQGGTLVGQPPLGPSGILNSEAMQQFTRLTHDLWGDCSDASHDYGEGRVYLTGDVRSVLATLKLAPDFDDSSGQLDYIHRADATSDIYFVRNTTARSVDSVARFRVVGRAPELWNAVDGAITPQMHYDVEAEQTSLPLHLDAYASVFVVFAHKDGMPTSHVPHAGRATEAPPPKSEEIPAARWTITFQPDRGAPSGPQPLQNFESWTASPDPGIRYFSGTATYRTEIDVKRRPGERIFLILTDVREICTVRVNGKTAGTLWAMPYRLDVTDALTQSRNRLELDVTNLWPNRIIGDAQLSATRTYTKTNIRKYTADSPLLPSGLIGPVSLEIDRPGWPTR